MTKGNVINCILSVALAGYLVSAVWLTSNAAAADTCSGLSIEVSDSVSHGFVTREDIAAEIQAMGLDWRNTPRNLIDLNALEQRLLDMDNIECVNCMILNNGYLHIAVTPLQPIARVFDTNGENYYINRDGKRMDANTRYRIDVPVVVGTFNTRRTPALCFPVIDYLEQHPQYRDMVTALEIRDNCDIILIPAVRGHVVNLGDTEDLDNKFDRLSVFYRKVLPVKGWEFYDTLSVKWRGQIVAKRRFAKTTAPEIMVEAHDDVDDVGTMSGGPNLPETIPAAADRKKEHDKPEADAKAAPPAEKKAAETPEKKSAKAAPADKPAKAAPADKPTKKESPAAKGKPSDKSTKKA